MDENKIAPIKYIIKNPSDMGMTSLTIIMENIHNDGVKCKLVRWQSETLSVSGVLNLKI